LYRALGALYRYKSLTPEQIEVTEDMRDLFYKLGYSAKDISKIQNEMKSELIERSKDY
jgi:hypothetical protein